MAGAVEEFFGNDIVYRFNKRNKIIYGIVTESYEASSDVYDFDNLEKGEMRIWWSSSSHDQIWKQNKVHLYNRNIIPGDVVRRQVQGQDTQRGYCKAAKQSVTLQIVGTDKVIEKVCSTRLIPTSKYAYGKTVCIDNRYGRVHNIEYKVVMVSKCGSCVELTHFSSSQSTLDDYWLSKRNRLYSDEFYTGQEVVCSPQCLSNATWIYRSKALKRRMQSRTRFTIQSTKIESVDVLWYNVLDDESTFMEPATITGDDLKRLSVLFTLDSHILDLSERFLLKLSASDNLMRKQDWLRKQSVVYRRAPRKISSKNALNKAAAARFRKGTSNPRPPAKTISDSEEWWTDDDRTSDAESTSAQSNRLTSANRRSKKKCYWPPRPTEIVAGNNLAVEILCFESKITVVWQDGTVEENVPSTQLCYSMSLDDHEFFPGEWVTAEANHNTLEYGAVQSVNHLERTAKVHWYKAYGPDAEKREPCFQSVGELSVYDLQKHQKYQFRPGSTVYPAGLDAECKLGYVLDSRPEGHVSVHWMVGGECRCWPQDLVLLAESEYDMASETSASSDYGSWETESLVSVRSTNEDAPQDENTLLLMASKLDFIRTKIARLREKFKQHLTLDNFMYMRDFLVMYDNSSYLDRLLGTSFFSRKSRHFKTLLDQVYERAKSVGIELSGRLFNSDAPPQNVKMKTAEKENIEKVRSLESSLNAQISKSQSSDSVTSPEGADVDLLSNGNLCVELLSMLKARMDLAYAEIVSRIGGQEALMVMTKALENTIPSNVAKNATEKTEKTPKAPEQVESAPESQARRLNFGGEGYELLAEAPKSHHFYTVSVRPSNPHTFMKAVNREAKLLEESSPPGVWIRGYEDRIDLISLMIRGPSKTPYEDSLFLFDIQLGPDFPNAPPSCHFISYSSERLNPNLYVEGKICVSLLGTWIGKGSEVWGPSSSLLQLVVSIQGLILVAEPYYNEAGYEKQLDSQQGFENSRTYNERVILKLLQAMTVLLISPPDTFRNEVVSHFAHNGQTLCQRIELWTSDADPCHQPEFPLLPVSKGFLLSLKCALASFKEISAKVIEDYKNEKVCENEQPSPPPDK